MPRPERKIEMQHSFVSSFLIVEENQKSEPSPLSRKGSDFYYSVRITGLEPARRRHWTLKPARLPIPPYPRTCAILPYSYDVVNLTPDSVHLHFVYFPPVS